VLARSLLIIFDVKAVVLGVEREEEIPDRVLVSGTGEPD
jgi:hypothetical protein